MADKPATLQELVQGIDSMLLRNRSSFTDDEVALLHDLRVELQKRIANENSIDAITAMRILEVLARVFGMLDFFKDMCE